MLLLALATNWVLVWLFVLIHGFAWGIRGPIQSAIRADYFGATSFGKIMGFSSMVVMMGMVIGPVVAGVLRDRTGDYRLGFTILAAVAALGSVWFFLATPPAPPRRHNDGSGPIPDLYTRESQDTKKI
jgi:MFS family permease